MARSSATLASANRPTASSAFPNPNCASLYFGFAATAARKFRRAAGRSFIFRNTSPKRQWEISHCLLGEVFLKMNDLPAALRNFRAAVAANPKYKEAQFGLGKAELAVGRFAEAKVALERAIGLDPDYIQAHYVLGRVLKKLGRLEDAKREITTAEQIQAKLRDQYAKK